MIYRPTITTRQRFEVEYHPNYLPTFPDEIGMHYAIPRTKRPDRPENVEEILDEPHNNGKMTKKTKIGTLTMISVLMAAL